MEGYQAIVVVANGVEELETVAIVDILRRANITVHIAGVHGKEEIKCSRDVYLRPDTSIKACLGHLYHAIIIPGGERAAKTMAADYDVGNLLVTNYNIGNKIGAICAGPLVLAAHKVGHGRRITAYPKFANQLGCDFHYQDGKRVHRDGHVITAQGPGSAMDFAFEMVLQIYGESSGREKVRQIKEDMCY